MKEMHEEKKIHGEDVDSLIKENSVRNQERKHWNLFMLFEKQNKPKKKTQLKPISNMWKKKKGLF